MKADIIAAEHRNQQRKVYSIQVIVLSVILLPVVEEGVG
jgi:hypothetical protein